MINELSKLGTTNIIITDEKMEGEHFTVDGVRLSIGKKSDEKKGDSRLDKV